MKIAIVHSYYRAGPSGETEIVNSSISALREAGHEVELFARHTEDELRRAGFEIRAGLRVATGLGHSPDTAIRRFNPDVVHVHNLHPNWSRNWLKSLNAPLVATLHNYRTLCSAGTLSRNGESCNLCPHLGTHHAVLNACYHGSVLKSIPLAIATRNPQRNPILRNAHRLIFLTTESFDLHMENGLSDLGAKAHIIPNFCPDFGIQETPSATASFPWIFAGRLSAEKGILELLKFWPKNQDLLVIGDGPLLKAAQEAAKSSRVRFLGSQTRDRVIEEMKKSAGLVFPSIWMEGGVPLVFIEALAIGLPVLAKSGSYVANKTKSFGCGAVFDDFSELPMIIESMKPSRPAFSKRSRSLFEEEFSAGAWLASTIRVYKEAILDFKALQSMV